MNFYVEGDIGDQCINNLNKTTASIEYLKHTYYYVRKQLILKMFQNMAVIIILSTVLIQICANKLRNRR
jgi:hypothetical protein